MTYTPTTWQDRVVESPNTYTETQNADGTITLTPAPGTVTQQGTPLSAANLNNLETQYNSAISDGGLLYGVDTSTVANTITVSVDPAPLAYVDGYSLRVKVANTTTGATTLDLNGLGAIAVKNADGTDVGAGDLVAGVPRIFTYVASSPSAFIAAGSGGLSASGNATPAEVLDTVTFTSESGRGQTGTMPNHTFAATGGSYTQAAGYLADGAGSLCIEPPTGYYEAETNASGFGELEVTDSNFVPANIANGVKVLSLTGTLKRYATGTGSTSSGSMTVSGLGFTPSAVRIEAAPPGSGSNGAFYYNGNWYVGTSVYTATVTFSSGSFTFDTGDGTYWASVQWTALE